MATLKDIAKNAGVSIGTVSAVLGNKQGVIRVSKKTEQKVFETARKLEYVPNMVARGLRTGQSFLIGFLTPKITSSFLPDIMEGIEEVLLDSNYGMLLSTYHTPEDMRRKIDFMLKKNIDAAIILTDPREQYYEQYELLDKKVPLVGLGEYDVGIELPRVYVDGVKIGEIATEYLISLGHTQIGCLVGSETRYRGFLNALKRHSLEPDEDLLELQSKSFETVETTIERYISKKKLPSAVICYSDTVAAELIAAAFRHNIKVPEQMSILGVDDASIAKMLTPALTTVSLGKLEQGEHAAILAMNLIRKETVANIVLEPKIVERKSCMVLSKI